MDAALVVHQLQRLAAEPHLTSSVREKLPRMTLGIAHLLGHPDAQTRTEAARTIHIIARNHGVLISNSEECGEILKLLHSQIHNHDGCSNVAVENYCLETISYLRSCSQDEKNAKDFAETNAVVDDDEGSRSKVKESRSMDIQEEVQQKSSTKQNKTARHADETSNCENENTINKMPLEEQSVEPNSYTETDEALETLDLFSIVLGLRGILKDQRTLQFAREKGNDLNALQTYLQLRLVQIWGVNSATIKLNTDILSKQLDSSFNQYNGIGNGPGNSLYLASNSENAAKKGSQEKEEGDGIAIVLIRLSRRPAALHKQLLNVRDAVGHSTLLLKSSMVQRASVSQSGESYGSFSRQGSTSERDIRDPHRAQYLDAGSVPKGNKAKAVFETISPESATAFSFFNANAFLFSQSRFSAVTIKPYDIDPELSQRLKREKVRRAELQLRQERNRSMMDRVIGSFGSLW